MSHLRLFFETDVKAPRRTWETLNKKRVISSAFYMIRPKLKDGWNDTETIREIRFKVAYTAKKLKLPNLNQKSLKNC